MSGNHCRLNRPKPREVMPHGHVKRIRYMSKKNKYEHGNIISLRCFFETAAWLGLYRHDTQTEWITNNPDVIQVRPDK